MDLKREGLLKKSMGKLFLELALPAVVGMVAIGLYQLVDAIFVGRMVDANALGAISLVYPLTLINNGIATLIGIGSSSVLSRAIGAQDQKTISKVFGNLTFWIAALSLVSMAVLYAFAAPLVSFMGAASGDMTSYAVDYLRIVALGSVFVNFAQGSNMLIRGEGKMVSAMTIMGAGTVLNIILDPIFIGLLGMGIRGAAWATVISQTVMAVMSFVYFARGRTAVPMGRIRHEPSILPGVLKVGVSAMLMQVMALVQQTLLYKSIAHYGTPAEIPVIGAALRLMAFAFIPVWGMSQGLQPVVGTSYGARKYARVRHAYRYFSAAATVFCGVAWLAFLLVPRTLLGWFLTDSALLDAGAPMVRTILCTFVFNGFMIMSITLFQAVGKGGAAAALIMGQQLGFVAPIMLILPLFLGLWGVLLAPPLASFLTALLSAVLVARLFRALPLGKGKEDDSPLPSAV